MNNINLSDEQLKIASDQGEKRSSESLSVLAKRSVQVSTTDVKTIGGMDATKALEEVKSHPVVAYSQALSGVEGVALLAMERQDALDMVDLFNNRPKGTTVVMQELDRSTIRETLNILSNSYISPVAKELQRPVMLDVPRMITQGSVDRVIDSSKVEIGSRALFFGTQLNVEGEEFEVKLHFLFFTGENKSE
jgi:chemotaxis protein CheY-P-specific phosphatase CheC